MPLITDDAAREIKRRLTLDLQGVESLALEFGVSLRTVEAIRDGKPWRGHAIRDRKYRRPKAKDPPPVDPDQLDMFDDPSRLPGGPT